MTDLTELRGGLIVRSDALLLALALEAKGCALGLVDEHGQVDGKLHVSNKAALTAEDKAQITALRNHLMACAGYTAPPFEGEPA